MNKRTMFIIGAVSAALLTSAGAVDANPTRHNIYVDGVKVNGAAYTINGNNYFKLRDLAAMVNGTEKQFEVTWDENAKAIGLLSNKPYTLVGGEMGAVSAAKQNASPSKASVSKDGVKANYAGYTINSNNYYKLRDVFQDMNIGVKWDEANQRVDILTAVGYGEEDKAEVTDPVEPTEPTDPVTPTEPTTPTTPSNPSNSTSDTDSDGWTILRDYRQSGDSGIRSANMGSSASPKCYYYPSYGKYSKEYQNLLDTCGEEIITRTIKYYTFCSQTGEKDNLSGFPVEIKVVDDRVSPNRWWNITTLYIDTGRGEFQLKMPKSIYDKVQSGEQVLTVSGSGIETVSQQTVINGKTYDIMGNRITAGAIRDDNPARIGLMLTYYSK